MRPLKRARHVEFRLGLRAKESQCFVNNTVNGRHGFPAPGVPLVGCMHSVRLSSLQENSRRQGAQHPIHAGNQNCAPACTLKHGSKGHRRCSLNKVERLGHATFLERVQAGRGFETTARQSVEEAAGCELQEVEEFGKGR